eukprot:gene23860-65733_t
MKVLGNVDLPTARAQRGGDTGVAVVGSVGSMVAMTPAQCPPGESAATNF